MTQPVRAMEQQSLRFWLSSWIPAHFPANTTYRLQVRDDGRWLFTLYLAEGKERTGTLWGTIVNDQPDVHLEWDK
jgi:hypothetical protein